MNSPHVTVALATEIQTDLRKLASFGITKSLVSRACQKSCTRIISSMLEPDARKNGAQFTTIDLSIISVSDAHMMELNAMYRGKNNTTDVLSFGFFESFDGGRTGELFISLDQVQVQANEFRHSIKFEWLFLLVHGLLHLFGFTDDTDETREQMERLGHELLKQLEMGEPHV